MTIGVVFRPESPRGELREVVRDAERAGVDELWLWEDCFVVGGIAAAAAALGWSERLRVGVGLLPVPLRNPALTAMEIATIADLFPGRFTPVFGHGVQQWMEQVGARVESPVTLLREYVAAVRALLHGDTVTVDGRYVRLDAVTLEQPPADVPSVLIGGRGPRTLRAAGEVSDGLLLDVHPDNPSIPDAVALASQDRAHGERPRVVTYVEVDTHAADLADQVAREIADRTAAGADSVVFQAPGDHPDPRPIIEALRAL